MALLPDVAPGQIITSSHLNAVKNSVNSLLGDVDAHGYKITALSGAVLSGTRPTILFDQGAGARARVMQIGTSSRVDLCANLSYDGANWQRDDTTQAATAVSIRPDVIYLSRAAAGANPATVTTPFTFDLANAKLGIGCSPAGAFPLQIQTAGVQYSAWLYDTSATGIAGVNNYNDTSTYAGFGIGGSSHPTLAIRSNAFVSTYNGFVVLINATEKMRVNSTGVGIAATPGTTLDVGGHARVSGYAPPTTGAGSELFYYTNESWLLSYDRTVASYKPIRIEGSVVKIGIDAGLAGTYFGGVIMHVPNGAANKVADADIQNNSIHFYLDAGALKVRVKDGATLKTGSIALS